MTNDSKEPRLLVSAVIIGRNEGARLKLCLQSVFSMVRANFDLEVIYVDSASTDDSVAMATTQGAHVIALTPERPTAALGRNAGWRTARGAVVLFLDGDTVLHSRFVADSLPEFSSARVAVVWGHRRELCPEHSTYNRTLDLDWIYPPGLSDYCGGDALFRRSVLAETNGFDDALIAGEEPELCTRIRTLGYQILHVDRPMTGHDLDITRWAQYWKRLARSGHAYAEIADRFHDADQALWSEEAARNRNRFLAITFTTFTAVLLSVVLKRWLPMGVLLALFASFSFRSAYKAAWKSEDKITLLFYGMHSHLQQIPIYLGQLQYKWSRWRGSRHVLFEYK